MPLSEIPEKPGIPAVTYECSEVVIVIVGGDLEMKLSQQIVQVVTVDIRSSSRRFFRHLIDVDDERLPSGHPNHAVRLSKNKKECKWFVIHEVH